MSKWYLWKHQNKSEANDKNSKEFDNKIQRNSKKFGKDPNFNEDGI